MVRTAGHIEFCISGNENTETASSVDYTKFTIIDAATDSAMAGITVTGDTMTGPLTGYVSYTGTISATDVVYVTVAGSAWSVGGQVNTSHSRPILNGL